LLHCSGPSTLVDADGGSCFPDSDGLTGGDYVFDLTVDDSGFSKNILTTQNLAQVTLTVKNVGTKAHGFEVECKSVTAPRGCAKTSCFPGASTIPPLAPGASETVHFATPYPEGIYTFKSNAPADSAVKALNEGQFILM
jgi:subtilase family serine protease